MPDNLKTLFGKGSPDHSRLLSVLLENNDELLVLLDKNGKIIYRSPSAARISGWSDQELLHTFFEQLPFHPHDRETIHAFFNEAFSNPLKTIPVRFRISHKKGHYIHVEGSIRNLLEDEQINAVVLNIRDVTNRVSREQMLQFYIESSPVAVAMFNQDMEYIVASKKWLSDFGLGDRDITGLSHYDLFPEITEEWKAILAHCLSGNSAKNEEDRFERADGTVQWLRWEVKPWWNITEEVGGIIIFSEEITTRKNTEQELLKSETKFRGLVERVSDGFISLDTDWKFTYVNSVAEKLLKRKSDELIGKNIWEEFPKAVNGPFYKAFHEGMVTLENIYIEDFSEPLNYSVSVRAYPSPSGLSVYFRDVSEEYNAKRTIKETEERFRKLVERISDAFIALDKDWRYVYSNKRAEEMFGKSNSDLVGRSIWDVFPNAVGGPFYNAYHQAMDTQKHLSFVNYSIYGKRWLEVNVYPSDSGLTVYFKDINERIEAENAARKSESVRQSIMRSALDAIVCVDKTNKIIVWNSQAEQLFGWKAKEVIGKQLENTIIPPSYRTRHREGYKRYIETGVPVIMNKLIEVAALNKDGSEFPIEMFVVKIDEGEESFYCAFIRNITDRKQNEEELLQINKRLKLTQQIAHIGGVEFNYEKGLLTCSDETLLIYGISDGRNEFTIEEWFTYIHPDDLAYVKETVLGLSESEVDITIYHRIRRPDGDVRYIQASTRTEFNTHKNQKIVYGVVHDITELKELEKKLLLQKEAEQKNITAAIISAQEKERNAIGEELHDNINQILTAVNLHLGRTKYASENLNEIIDVSMEYLTKAIEENRKIARELVIPDFGIDSLEVQLEKLTWLMLGAESISVDLDYSLYNKNFLNKEQKLTVYRIVQEQCTNIIKYAKASSVKLLMETTDNMFKMMITDNGVGMNKNEHTNGIGLRNIKSRLSLLNGTEEIISEPGHGFSLLISFPVVKSGDQS